MKFKLHLAKKQTKFNLPAVPLKQLSSLYFSFISKTDAGGRRAAVEAGGLLGCGVGINECQQGKRRWEGSGDTRACGAWGVWRD